ncbi:COMM domain-containing protein 10 [Histomonas meleagridis]|uniref:COMM domain-containing protein 10 n=1 Tax=Histomonas meleagridis TaxID=135588 RepID=UPI00355A978A|nr:COMM domain-containing protein 10 [Histomonas meleagridis]KAH0801236.1 COMM domain-containing protein 10 [Histomonas meleagridis]
MSDQSNSQLQAALKIPEKIQPRQFAQILRRLAIALETQNPSPFSEDEVQILLEQFEMTPTEFDAMFSSCLYVLQQAACFSFDSEKTQVYASQCGANESTAECFSAVWDAEGDNLIETLKQRTISGTTLESTSWRLNLKTAEQNVGVTRDPVMLLDLNLNNEKPISIQFDHEGLSKFYQEIEKIQQQIDSLT